MLGEKGASIAVEHSLTSSAEPRSAVDPVLVRQVASRARAFLVGGVPALRAGAGSPGGCVWLSRDPTCTDPSHDAHRGVLQHSVFQVRPRTGDLLARGGPSQGSRVFIHETAVVEESVDIGEGTNIWHHAHLRASSRIGAGCTLGKNVFIDAGVIVGDRVKIQNNVSVYRGVTIEDDVFVGPSAVFTNDRVPRATGEHWDVVPTIVRRGASIGANATIVCGVEVAAAAMVAAGAVVTRDVAAHELVAGNPARHLGWVCACGRTVRRDLASAAGLRCADCGTGD